MFILLECFFRNERDLIFAFSAKDDGLRDSITSTIANMGLESVNMESGILFPLIRNGFYQVKY